MPTCLRRLQRVLFNLSTLVYSTQSMKYSTHQASGAVRPVTQPLRLPANAQHTHVLLERISQPDVRIISGTLHSFCGAATQTRKRVALHQFAELETSAWRIWHSAPQLIHVFFSRNGITCQKSSHRKNLASLIIHNTIIIKWIFPKWGLPL